MDDFGVGICGAHGIVRRQLIQICRSLISTNLGCNRYSNKGMKQKVRGIAPESYKLGFDNRLQNLEFQAVLVFWRSKAVYSTTEDFKIVTSIASKTDIS
jgi:hypothetical protein